MTAFAYVLLCGGLHILYTAPRNTPLALQKDFLPFFVSFILVLMLMLTTVYLHFMTFQNKYVIQRTSEVNFNEQLSKVSCVATVGPKFMMEVRIHKAGRVYIRLQEIYLKGRVSDLIHKSRWIMRREKGIQ